MSRRRLRSAAFAIALVAAGRTASAQSPPVSSPPERPTWHVSGLLYNYLIPDDRDYLQPTIAGDRGRVHLEVRANYEGLGVGSAWFGWNFCWAKPLELEVTPMFGGVFGDTKGVAAGGRGKLSWEFLEISTESEYVFDANGKADWFYYNWSQFTFAPADWLYVGLVAQRTRAYEGERDIQRGFLVGFSLGRVDIAAHMFNPDDSHSTYVLSAAVKFFKPRK